ncbi:MAG: hypothetical protein LC808_44175 [Actinobacteria bacterium]|nr:hypothetical protein [Actinomycetota bacterium]
MDFAPGTPPLPWRYPYQRDRPRQREVLRPLVSVRLRGQDLSSGALALVDSGSEHIVAAPWLASDAKADLAHPKYETELGMGGGWPAFKFVDLAVRLQHPDGEDDHYVEWEAEVGFTDKWRAPWPVLLGQHGFFDQFTVSMHRSAALTIIEEWRAFDERFGVDAAPAQGAPRKSEF